MSRRGVAVCTIGFLLGLIDHVAEAQDSSRMAENAPYRIVGYVTSQTDIWDVDAEKLTHVNYAFAQVSEADTIGFQNETAPQHLAQLQALKARNPDLKLLVSVGGWGAENFSEAALTDSSRATFARSAVRMVKRYGLDGADIDWEFPGQAVGGIEARPDDKRNFTLLLKTLRRHLDSLSVARGRGTATGTCSPLRATTIRTFSSTPRWGRSTGISTSSTSWPTTSSPSTRR
jgi:chitinase